jgi:hypothetical protein
VETPTTRPHKVWNGNNIMGEAHDVALTAGLLYQLLVETVQVAASTRTPRWFATGVMDSPMVFYSLAQCTPDLSAGDCLVCLTRLLGMVNFNMTVPVGGQIHVIRCYFRYEAYPFYRYPIQSRVHLGRTRTPAPTPATTPVKHKSKFPWFMVDIHVLLCLTTMHV